ncbi:MAG TPA: hypothetical protein VI259_11920 [Gemmatimonadaceae bacterium]
MVISPVWSFLLSTDPPVDRRDDAGVSELSFAPFGRRYTQLRGVT